MTLADFQCSRSGIAAKGRYFEIDSSQKSRYVDTDYERQPVLVFVFSVNLQHLISLKLIDELIAIEFAVHTISHSKD